MVGDRERERESRVSGVQGGVARQTERSRSGESREKSGKTDRQRGVE